MIERLFDKLNNQTSVMGLIEGQQIENETEYESPFGLKKGWGPGLYLIENSIIKRYYFSVKEEKRTKKYVTDKMLMPTILMPVRCMNLDGKEEIELKANNITRILTDEALTGLKDFKKFLMLFSRDYWFDGDLKDVVEFHKILVRLKKELDLKIIKTTGQFGWSDNSFVPYDMPIFVDDPILKTLEKSFNKKGNKQEWLNKINKYRNNIAFEMQFLAALQAPAISKYKIIPGWYHVSEKRSTGKTAGMMAIVSIYGNPEDNGENLIVSFNTTVVGLENRMHVLNNLPVFLNDSQNLDKKIPVDKLIYMAFEGKGRSRGRQDEKNRKVKNWRTNIITNGEAPLIANNSYEGIYKRCIQIHEKMMYIDDAKEARRFCQDNYGLIGNEWIEIIKNIEKEIFYKIQDQIYDQLKQDCNKIDDNILQISSLTAIRYFYEININKINEKDALLDSIKKGKEMLNLIDIDNDNVQMCNKIMNYLNEFIMQNPTRFNGDTINFEKYGFYKDGNICFYNNMLQNLLNEQFNYSLKLFTKEVKEKGFIELDKKGQLKLIRHGGKTLRCLQFKENVFDNNIENDLPINQNNIIPIKKTALMQTFKTATLTRNLEIKINANDSIDINTKDKNIIFGKIFLNNSDNIIIPDFKEKEMKKQCYENLTFFGISLKPGKDLFEQIQSEKQIKIENSNKIIRNVWDNKEE